MGLRISNLIDTLPFALLFAVESKPRPSANHIFFIHFQYIRKFQKTENILTKMSISQHPRIQIFRKLVHILFHIHIDYACFEEPCSIVLCSNHGDSSPLHYYNLIYINNYVNWPFDSNHVIIRTIVVGSSAPIKIV